MFVAFGSNQKFISMPPAPPMSTILINSLFLQLNTVNYSCWLLASTYSAAESPHSDTAYVGTNMTA